MAKILPAILLVIGVLVICYCLMLTEHYLGPSTTHSRYNGQDVPVPQEVSNAENKASTKIGDAKQSYEELKIEIQNLKKGYDELKKRIIENREMPSKAFADRKTLIKRSLLTVKTGSLFRIAQQATNNDCVNIVTFTTRGVKPEKILSVWYTISFNVQHIFVYTICGWTNGYQEGVI